jgi:hypothetical protein
MFIADMPLEMKTDWEQYEAIALCSAIENICPKYGCHVALTGGLLYKDGRRKDADILFYRIRQKPEIDIEGLFYALKEIDDTSSRKSWCIKGEYKGKKIDFLKMTVLLIIKYQPQKHHN